MTNLQLLRIVTLWKSPFIYGKKPHATGCSHEHSAASALLKRARIQVLGVIEGLWWLESPAASINAFGKCGALRWWVSCSCMRIIVRR